MEVDLAEAGAAIPVPPHYDSAFVLLRWRKEPLGDLRVSISNGQLLGSTLWTMAIQHFSDKLATAVLEDWLPPAAEHSNERTASCSVVVCTRNRRIDLRRCLDSICRAAPPDVEIIVVDNAPSDTSTEKEVARYPVRYVVEPRQGLNWARGRGARTAAGDVIIYTDDDVVVDANWIDAMRNPFTDPTVAAVTGLVLPLEMETPTQEDCERIVSYKRGYQRKSFNARNMNPLLVARIGAGASMALRRTLVVDSGVFDVELDCGTVARSGGDHYAFYRILKAGHTIVYNPAAISWHRHRRSHDELRKMMFGYSVGAYCYLLRCLIMHREVSSLAIGLGWFRHHHMRELCRGILRRRGAQPLDLTWAEWRGVFVAGWAFPASLYKQYSRRERLCPARKGTRPADL